MKEIGDCLWRLDRGLRAEATAFALAATAARAAAAEDDEDEEDDEDDEDDEDGEDDEKDQDDEADQEEPEEPAHNYFVLPSRFDLKNQARYTGPIRRNLHRAQDDLRRAQKQRRQDELRQKHVEEEEA